MQTQIEDKKEYLAILEIIFKTECIRPKDIIKKLYPEKKPNPKAFSRKLSRLLNVGHKQDIKLVTCETSGSSSRYSISFYNITKYLFEELLYAYAEDISYLEPFHDKIKKLKPEEIYNSKKIHKELEHYFSYQYDHNLEYGITTAVKSGKTIKSFLTDFITGIGLFVFKETTNSFLYNQLNEDFDLNIDGSFLAHTMPKSTLINNKTITNETFEKWEQDFSKLDTDTLAWVKLTNLSHTYFKKEIINSFSDRAMNIIGNNALERRNVEHFKILKYIQVKNQINNQIP